MRKNTHNWTEQILDGEDVRDVLEAKSLNVDEISNFAVVQELKENKNIVSLFKHKYKGGQVDWGVKDKWGVFFAWYGGDKGGEVDEKDLYIIKEWDVKDINF